MHMHDVACRQRVPCEISVIVIPLSDMLKTDWLYLSHMTGTRNTYSFFHTPSHLNAVVKYEGFRVWGVILGDVA